MRAATRSILFQPATIQWLTGGLYSATPAYTGWSTSGSVITRSVVLSPDKKLNGMLIVEDGATSTHAGVHTGITYSQTAIPYVHTVYARRVTGDRNVMVVMFDSTATFALSVKVDLGTGVVSAAPTTDGSWTALSATTRRLSSGWVKIEFFFTGITDTSMWFVYRLLSGITESYTGNSVSSIGVWGTDLRAV